MGSEDREQTSPTTKKGGQAYTIHLKKLGAIDNISALRNLLSYILLLTSSPLGFIIRAAQIELPDGLDDGYYTRRNKRSSTGGTLYYKELFLVLLS